MTDKVITEKWTETKSALMEGLEGQRAKSMETVLENTKTYLAEAEQYQRLVTNGLELVDRWKAEGVERRNEAWAIWRDHPQYAPAYQLSNRYQTGGATTAS